MSATAKKSGVQHTKACRCRGASSGKFLPPADWTPPIPPITLGVGMLMGLPLVMTCDKCGKEWKAVEVKGPAKTRAVRGRRKR